MNVYILFNFSGDYWDYENSETHVLSVFRDKENAMKKLSEFGCRDDDNKVRTGTYTDNFNVYWVEEHILED